MKSVFVLALFLQIGRSEALAANWPIVKATSATQEFQDVSRAQAEATLQDVDGRPVYRLACRSGDLNDEEDFNYSGLFHCRLVSLYSTERLPSLLIDDEHATRDWEGRARFLDQQVLGPCAKVAEWGAVRTLYLRNMRITLEVEPTRQDEQNGRPGVAAFRFRYEVRSDDEATSAIAMKAGSPEPVWFLRGDRCPLPPTKSR